MLLAGFTDVPVSPMPRMCTPTSVRPMMSPPKEPWEAFLLVTPRIDITKMNVRTISTRRPASAFPLTPASPLLPNPPVASVTPPKAKMTASSCAPAYAPRIWEIT